MSRSTRTSPIRPGALLVLGACWTLLAAIPAPGANASPWQGVRADALSRLETARELLTTSRLADAVRAAASLAEVDLPAATTAAHGDPVAALLTAIETAEAQARGALHADPAAIDRANRGLVAALGRARGLAGEARVAARYQRRWASAVDQTALLSAALTLATAIDHALPALAASPPSGGEDVCDVVVITPVLCVGGDGANSHSADFALLIDLGGDDTYTNSAGGADPLGNGLPVSVVLDLGGNDTYSATLPVSSGARVAQGSGLLGGIGVLVDNGGNDTYTATSSPGAGAWAQGFTAAGVGIQLDVGGNDSYRISNLAPYARNPASPLNFAFYAAGKGVATFGGVGISIDTAGAETHVIEARPQLAVDAQGVLHPGDNVLAHGFGLGVFGGIGLYSEGQGTDTMILEAVSAPVAPDEPRPFVRPDVSAFGFGTGGVGIGVAVTGPGISNRAIRSVAEAPETAFVDGGGYGRGTIGGYGAAHDAGGNDTYVAEVVSRASRRAAIDDSCGCSGVAAHATTDVAFLDAVMGAGGLGGVGILHDNNGDDKYLATATATAEAEATDRRTVQVPPSSEEDPVGVEVAAASGIARTHAQGFGINAAAGFLEDLGGNDVYDSRATSEARATADATLPDVPVDAGAASAQAISRAQAAGASGYGELHDGQGNDTYTSTNTSRATETERGRTEEFPGLATSSVQASAEAAGQAILVDADTGMTDTFSATPADPACTGTRGTGVWQDCGDAAGVGANP